MPKDMNGKFHMSGLRSAAMKKEDKPAEPHDSGKPPMESEHGSDVASHLSQMHAEHGGTHLHVHHDGVSYKSHHVKDDGQVQGPHEHGSTDELNQHISSVFDGDADDPNAKPTESYGDSKDHSLMGM